MDYEMRTFGLFVMPKGESIFSELATKISIEDEGGGEFISISQTEKAGIRIDPKEWKIIKKAIDKLVKECRE